MASGASGGLRTSRDDPLSADRIELLDLDELAKKLIIKQHQLQSLSAHLEGVQQQIAACVNVLGCSSDQQLDELEEQERDDARRRLTLQDSNVLLRWTNLQDRVALHKLMGTEVITVDPDRFIINIHCYENNFPTLPQKILRIDRINESNSYCMIAREVFYFLIIDVALRDRMVKSTKEQMIQCFQTVQGLLFDLVDRENTHQRLLSLALICNSVWCNRSRTVMSVMFPRRLEEMSLGGRVLSLRQRSTAVSVVRGSVTLTLEVLSSSGCWGGIIYCHDGSGDTLPDGLKAVLRDCLLELPHTPVVECVEQLVRKLQLLMRPLVMDHSDDEHNDEFMLF